MASLTVTGAQFENAVAQINNEFRRVQKELDELRAALEAKEQPKRKANAA